MSLWGGSLKAQCVLHHTVLCWLAVSQAPTARHWRSWRTDKSRAPRTPCAVALRHWDLAGLPVRVILDHHEFSYPSLGIEGSWFDNQVSEQWVPSLHSVYFARLKYCHLPFKNHVWVCICQWISMSLQSHLMGYPFENLSRFLQQRVEPRVIGKCRQNKICWLARSSWEGPLWSKEQAH